MTSSYLDRLQGVETSVAIKAPVLVATTASITLSGEQTVDGVAVVTGDRVLVKDQASAIDNGIWDVSTGAWSRSDDFNGVRDAVRGTRVYVASGTTNGNTEWSVITSAPEIGVSSLSFMSLGSAFTSFFGAARNSGNATIMAASLTDGEVGIMGGLVYEKDSTATGTASCTNDLGVAGLVPFGAYQPGHFGTVTEGADISGPLKRCLDAAFVARDAHVVMPRGNFLLSSAVVASFPASGSGYPRHTVSIDLLGAALTIPVGNTTGGLKITKHNNFQCLNIRNVTIYSDHTYDGATTAGYGLIVESSIGSGDAGWGAAGYSELFMTDVMVGTDRGAAEGRFDDGVTITNIWYPRLHRVDATTRFEYDLPDNGSFEAGAGIKTDGCYSPELHACRAFGKWDVGIELTDADKPGFENFALIDCQSVNARIAALVNHTNAGWSADALKEPGGTIIGGHYNGAQSGIEIHHHQSVTIRDPLVYLTNPDQATALTTYADGAFIRLVDCHEIHVMSPILNFGGHYTSDSDCSSGIRLEGTTEKCLIDGARIYHDGIGINNQASGSGNIVRGTIFDGRGPGSAGAPTKEYLDSSNLLRGEVQTPGTPVVQFGGAAVGQTYGTQTSGFTQEGRTVHWWVDIIFTAKGSSTGAAVIVTNFPNRDASAVAGAAVAFATAFTTNAPGGAFVTSGGDLQLYYEASTGALNGTVTDANFQDTSQLRLSGSYVAAQ